ncbi:hypothetical protein SAMN02990966_06499 [Rhodospirillales bacterium URHD0017]|nr:hypothetical protein SAMN02990966_06499 [Rhodospirillales bacterium URHD0017]
MKAQLSGLLVIAAVVPESAYARGGHSGGFGGLLVLVPVLIIIGFAAYWFLRKAVGGKEKNKEPLLSGEALLFHALFGLIALIVSVPFILLGVFLWGAAYSNRVSPGQALPGIIIFGVISFFIARWFVRSVQRARSKLPKDQERRLSPK